MPKLFVSIVFSLLSAFVLFLSSSPLANGRGLKELPAGAGPVTATFLNIGGMVFQPGQYVGVKWLLEGEGVRYFESHPWGECELFYSTDDGRTWSRITPQLSVTRRSFEWWVPHFATQAGKLALHIGIEGEGEFYVFPSPTFTVLPGSR